MARRLLVPCALLAALVLPSAASAAVVAPDLSVSSVAATGGAVAYLDDAGGIWATRVRADGTTGSPLPVASGQRQVRDLQVVVTDRGETVVVWDTMSSSTSGLVRYAVAAKGIGFSGARTLASVGVELERDATGSRAARRDRRRAVPRRALGHLARRPALRAPRSRRDVRQRPVARRRRRPAAGRGGPGRRRAARLGAGRGGASVTRGRHGEEGRRAARCRELGGRRRVVADARSRRPTAPPG